MEGDKIITNDIVTAASGRSDLFQGSGRQKRTRLETLEPEQSENDVKATENDEMDRVYETNKTDQPFKIDDLGGYDPEEDFNTASIDIQGSNSDKKNRRDKPRYKMPPRSSDPDPDLAYDGSDSDESNQSQAEPYQPDLETEVLQEAQNRQRSYPSESAKERLRQRDDDSDGSWVDDGIDDMEIPDEQEQEKAIMKGTSNDNTDQKSPTTNDPQQDDVEEQRMPNAEYLKNDLGIES